MKPEDSTDLPIREVLPPLRDALNRAKRAVLCAPPGSGKTTLVPLALLDESWLKGRRIIMLEPRRVAARAAAARMASLLGERVGGQVGYQVRFDRRVSAATRIEVLTEGLLVQRLRADPELPRAGLIIFDEVHERSLHVDLALALTLEVCDTLRPDLRVLVMSATLQAEPVSDLLGGATVIEGQGRSFPVDIQYRSPPSGASIGSAAAWGVRAALNAASGDVLAFLPGKREIREAQHALSGLSGARALPLHGDLSSVEQDDALSPSCGSERKVILATNIAQTSLTVEGVTAVVDGGWTRIARYDAGAGADRLETRQVSRASAEQRAGRAGRLGPGLAIRLWSSDQHAARDAQDEPEILRADLSRLVLELASWGMATPDRPRLLTRPPAAAWQSALDLLQALDAIDHEAVITAHGQRMLELPLPPRLAHMLIIAGQRGWAATGAWVAAALESRAPEGTPLDEWVSRLRHSRGEAGGWQVRDTVKQLLRLIDADDTRFDADACGLLAATAYPERIGRRRSAAQGVFLCADGGEARLPSHHPLSQAEWLVAAHWQPGSSRRIRLAAALQESEVLEDNLHRIRERDEVYWDDQTQAVVSQRVRRLGAIVLSSKPAAHPDADAVRGLLMEALRRKGPEALSWTDDARQWQARVGSLRAWRPEEAWPDVSNQGLVDTLDDWLAPWLDGINSLAQVRRLDIESVLAALLDHGQRQRLDQLAPSRIRVPSGASHRLNYAPDGRAPVLAVKLQELFGLCRTPTVDGGRRSVMLHLLSPARRPVQMTDDLAGFWSRTYFEVRKELKGRYPKHPWPEDPLAAMPTARAKPRK